jgi:hypothetical protein
MGAHAFDLCHTTRVLLLLLHSTSFSSTSLSLSYAFYLSQRFLKGPKSQSQPFNGQSPGISSPRDLNSRRRRQSRTNVFPNVSVRLCDSPPPSTLCRRGQSIPSQSSSCPEVHRNQASKCSSARITDLAPFEFPMAAIQDMGHVVLSPGEAVCWFGTAFEHSFLQA